MELNYIPSESTVKPSVIQMARSTVFVRRNIVEDARTDDQGNTTTYWTYEEACLSPSDFNAYVEEVCPERHLRHPQFRKYSAAPQWSDGC